jgi:type II secretory pathway pseudopilin PulG
LVSSLKRQDGTVAVIDDAKPDGPAKPSATARRWTLGRHGYGRPDAGHNGAALVARRSVASAGSRGGLIVNPRRRHIRVATARADDGFTLVELLIVCMIIPIIVGALALSLLAILSEGHQTEASISDTADAQTVSAVYETDVMSAVNLTTSTATQCGPTTGATQLLGLEWGYNQQTSQYETVVSYVEINKGTTSALVREYCATGASTTPTSSTTISSDIPTSQPAPTITTVSGYSASPSTSWATAVGVTGVTFSITEPGSNYAYSLTAVPRASTSSSQFAGVVTPTTTCGFATPGTGVYASTLCFANFYGYNGAGYNDGYNVVPNPAGSPLTPAPSNCQTMTEAVPNTPFTLSFCVSTSSSVGWVVPWQIPTYASSSSEAYLGNNGFYTGIPGDPALYQSYSSGASGATSYVYITKIKLLDQNGNPASNWELVTGDAETTDAYESITWTSNQDLTLLVNSPTSPYGNSCNSGLVGVDTTSVKCSSSVSSDKTGTVMLEASAPTSLTVTLSGGGQQGNGLEAMFLGVLLPW